MEKDSLLEKCQYYQEKAKKRMSKMSLLFFLLTTFCSIDNIIGLIIGAKNVTADECGLDTNIIFNSSQWLIIGGTTAICITIIIIILNSIPSPTLVIIAMIMNLIYSLFLFSWAIVGSHLLTNSNKNCANDHTGVYITSILVILFSYLKTAIIWYNWLSQLKNK